MIALLCGPGLPRAGAQQTYRNIVNMRFRAVGNGPQSALIVDVNNLADDAAVRQAVQRQVSAYIQARDSSLRRELDFLRRQRALRPGQPIDINDTVILRQNGRLALPRGGGQTRAANSLTFRIPTQGDGAWSAQDAVALKTQLVDPLYTELLNILGPPAWNGEVTILNKDPRLGKVDSVIGALLVVNGSDVQIWFPTFSAFQTKFLAMAQVMAQAFHGPAIMGYDAWEKGMARAAALVAARDLFSVFTENGQSVSAAANSLGFYYTPFYDLLNQPPLGNNTFTPPTKSNQDLNQNLTTLAGMLVPRLQMSSTAWLKCYIENPNFFQAFNAAYYAAFAADPSVANDTNRLRQFAAAAAPTVEGLPFDDWLERQYVLDTSVTPGRKLYAYVQPTFPSGAQGEDSGAAIFLVYYQTTPDGDELDRNGTANLVYWDYSFSNRLFLPSFETATITNGFGSVAPFFTNIGGDPADRMRVAIDVPVNQEYVRVYFPAGQTGTEDQPNDFSGVVVGADAGSLTVTYQGGSGPIATQVVQGAFGAIGPQGSVPQFFSRTALTFTPTGGQPLTYQRNTAFSNTLGVAPIFVLYAPGQSTTLSHRFDAGPQMISLPLRPFTNNLAHVLGSDPGLTLLAQWRQELSGNDKYMRYPSLPLYEPGYGLWSNFASQLNATNIQGERTDNQKDISVALQYGWNQIGPPYDAALSVDTDLQVQYLDNEAVSFAEAVNNGWIAAGIMGYASDTGYVDITNSSDARFPRGVLQSWKGYWVRVLVPEGVTLTYINPNNRSARRNAGTSRSRAVLPTPAHEPGSWRVPLFVRDADGNMSMAVFGQSPHGSNGFVPSLDVASPPPFTRASTLGVRFPHADWDTGLGVGGDFLSDFRRSAARAEWNVVVTVPRPEQNYTLAWSDTAALPRGMRLTVVDTETGTRQLMNSTSGMAFRVGPNTTTRRFQIIAEPHAPGRLFIRNVTAIAPLVGGRAATTLTISYELSAPAETRLEIRQAGRIVRHLAPGRAAASGVNQAVWDMRDDQGRILPAVPYALEITARTPEGEQTRSVMPLLITR